MASGPPALALHEALTGNTGFLLSRMGMAASRAFAERIAAVGLTPRGWGALNVLDKEGAITQQWLGTCIGMDPSSMVATIDELEAAGLVERRRNPHDRRAHALHITAKGRRALTEGRKVARRAQEELLAPLDADERRQLHELLLRLVQGSGQANVASSSERAATG
ncbi:MAG TPA: MarR family winged helix-turn-helix transcriptional regulator [Solirubrobacteraceae bacterium]|nr:MarR family winged helix-turn-helix transcriptional regulator [Solirubrobacteraceae bacterium]